MAITILEQNTVIAGSELAKKLVQEIKPALDFLNVVYDADDGVKETLIQGDLDGVPAFSGITKAQVDDGMFALTSSLKTALDGVYSQLTILASRS